MSGKAWAAVIAVMAALGAIAAGCGAGNDPSCPAARPKVGTACTLAAATTCTYDDDTCSLVFACNSDRRFGVTSSVCSPVAVDCWAAANGDVCAVPGDSCGEQEDPCSSGFLNQCGDDHRWKAGGTSIADCCAARSTCPAAQPNAGDACESCFGVVLCSFGCAQATCSSNTWQIDLSACPPSP